MTKRFFKGTAAGMAHSTNICGRCPCVPLISRISLSVEAFGWAEFGLCSLTLLSTCLWVYSSKRVSVSFSHLVIPRDLISVAENQLFSCLRALNYLPFSVKLHIHDTSYMDPKTQRRPDLYEERCRPSLTEVSANTYMLCCEMN